MSIPFADTTGAITNLCTPMRTHAEFLNSIRSADPRWLSSTVLDMADACAEFPELFRILADALMDAGCDDDQILNECHRRGLLAAIIADKRSDHPRLEYADWLQRNGDKARAEFIRVQCELAKSRLSLLPEDKLAYHPNANHLYQFERHLLFSLSSKYGTENRIAWAKPVTNAEWIFDRGFVSRISCDWIGWLTNHEQIVITHPVECVRFVDAPLILITRSQQYRDRIIQIPGCTARFQIGDTAWRDAGIHHDLLFADAVHRLFAAQWPGIDFRFEVPPMSYEQPDFPAAINDFRRLQIQRLGIPPHLIGGL